MFVVCWVYSRKALEDEKPWIMVLNKNRGWELPGGEISENEDFDIAALRELYEETGLLGTAIRYDEGIIEKHIEGPVQSPSLTTFIVLTFIFDILRKSRSENLHQ